MRRRVSIMKIIDASRRFRHEEDGVISIELLFVVPILVWALLSTFVYFDVYRAEAIATRAGITIADMISREEEPITEDYLEGAQNLLALLTEVDNAPDLRVTVFWYDEDSDLLEQSWSYTDGYGDTLDSADLNNIEDRIPMMANLDRAILVETRTSYEASFSYSIGPFSDADLSDVEFDTFTVIKPRFLAQFCFDELPTVEDNDMDC